MFIAQVDEIDVYDASGHQVEDVNTLIDLLRVTFQKQKDPHHRKDTDDDNARYFHVVRLGHLFNQPFFNVIESKECNGLINFPQLPEPKIASIYSEIQSPPPKV
jgi:hypothetical protein